MTRFLDSGVDEVEFTFVAMWSDTKSALLLVKAGF
jgi:hypothetical protein